MNTDDPYIPDTLWVALHFVQRLPESVRSDESAQLERALIDALQTIGEMP